MPDPSPIHLSVVIPAYNEERRLEGTVRQAVAYLQRHHPNAWELLVVADGCTDGTEVVASSLGAEQSAVRLISYQPNRGKGYAVRAGMKASRGEWVLFTDADGATALDEIAKLWSATEAGADVAIASRQAAGARLSPPQPWSRRALGRLFSIFTQRALRLPIKDTQCGFKLFRGTLARELAAVATLNRYAIDLELLLLARLRGAKIEEVGVVWQDQPGSQVHPLRDGMRMVRDALELRRRYLK